jgi:hypothetical protein
MMERNKERQSASTSQQAPAGKSIVTSRQEHPLQHKFENEALEEFWLLLRLDDPSSFWG